MQTTATSLILPMPAIEGVTVPHKDLHFLRPELLLDFISVTEQRPLFVTPVAVLHSTLGVLQRTELRKIPVAIAGRVVYPISSLALPCLHARLIINASTQKIRFQGSLVSSPVSSARHMVLVGLALELTVARHPQAIDAADHGLDGHNV